MVTRLLVRVSFFRIVFIFNWKLWSGFGSGSDWGGLLFGIKNASHLLFGSIRGMELEGRTGIIRK